MAYETVCWGILGCGNIAKKFADGLKVLPDAKLMACGSRSADKAAEFGKAYGIPNPHGTYEDLVADSDVDAIYVATPHTLHSSNSVLALGHGKAVLCEKPFAVNARQAKTAIDFARQKKVFLMEAMWSRFLPVAVKCRELLAEGAIGDVRMIMADFGFRGGWNPESRLLNPHLAGGGLLDVGVYPIAFTSMVLGRPDRVTGFAEIGKTGVDEQAAIVFGYNAGPVALLACGVRTNTPQDARILGTEGSITIPSFWHGQKVILARYGKETETIEPPFEGNGYQYQAAEVHRCLREGKTESPTMPLDETLAIAETMDELRAQWGLRYPFE